MLTVEAAFLFFALVAKVTLQMNALTSTRTLLPLDYYSLPMCGYPRWGRSKKRKIWTFYKRSNHGNENLGEVLNGDLIQDVPYELYMKQDMYCEQLCYMNSVGPREQQHRGRWSSSPLVRAIRNQYHTNWIADNFYPPRAILKTGWPPRSIGAASRLGSSIGSNRATVMVGPTCTIT
jgi:hypothetical protein